MQRRALVTIVECLALLGAFRTAPLAISETLDRIAVTVDRHVISQHDILQDIRLSAFIDSKAADFSAEQKRKAANHLVDQYLVLHDADVTRTPMPSASDIAAILEPIKARYGSDQEYRSALAAARIADAELAEHLLAGLRMLRYTDLRFRPEVEISEEALRAYYDKVTATQTARPSFEVSRSDIEKLLTGEQTMKALDRWLAGARSESSIVYHKAAFE
jgi:hypothetical protein